MDAHEGQAAWTQAIGSVIAILASAAFAIVAPLYLRHLEGRDAATRALKNSINSGALIRASWEALRAMYNAKAITDGTKFIMAAQLGSFKATIAEVPRHLLGPDALLAIGNFETNAAMIEVAVPRAQELQDGPGDQETIPFDEIIANLEEHAALLDEMRPRKVGGIWHVDHVQKRTT